MLGVAVLVGDGIATRGDAGCGLGVGRGLSQAASMSKNPMARPVIPITFALLVVMPHQSGFVVPRYITSRCDVAGQALKPRYIGFTW